MQVDDYRASIEAAGLSIATVRDNPQHQFLSSSVQDASRTYGFKSISLLAVKQGEPSTRTVPLGRAAIAD